jgi:hypothetical protein
MCELHNYAMGIKIPEQCEITCLLAGSKLKKICVDFGNHFVVMHVSQHTQLRPIIFFAKF